MAIDIGIRGAELEWFQGYLNGGGMQCVRLGDAYVFSAWVPVLI